MPEPVKGRPHAYLGDGVRCSFDGYSVWLSAERNEGHCELPRSTVRTHRIALEPEVMSDLVLFISTLRKHFPGQPVPLWEALRASVKREELRGDPK